MSEENAHDIDAEEWEEICPEEVERVISQLDALLESVESETIHAFLSEAYDQISALVDWEEEDDSLSDAA